MALVRRRDRLPANGCASCTHRSHCSQHRCCSHRSPHRPPYSKKYSVSVHYCWLLIPPSALTSCQHHWCTGYQSVRLVLFQPYSTHSISVPSEHCVGTALGLEQKVNQWFHHTQNADAGTSYSPANGGCDVYECKIVTVFVR